MVECILMQDNGARFGNWVDGNDREPYGQLWQRLGNVSFSIKVSCVLHGLAIVEAKSNEWELGRPEEPTDFLQSTHNHPEGSKELWRRLMLSLCVVTFLEVTVATMEKLINHNYGV